jgi:hypothetical protein
LSKFLKSAAVAAAKKRDYDQLKSSCQASGENFLFRPNQENPNKPPQTLLPFPANTAPQGPLQQGRCAL